MKTLILAVATLFSTVAFAGNSKDQIQKTVEKDIYHPSVSNEIEMEGTVMVSFSYDEYCNLEVSGLNYSDIELAEFVVQKLANITPDEDVIGKEYHYRFDFTKE